MDIHESEELLILGAAGASKNCAMLAEVGQLGRNGDCASSQLDKLIEI